MSWRGALGTPGLVITALVSAGAPAEALAETAIFALVVGNNVSTDPEQKPLRYADDDAAHFAWMLTGGRPSDRIRLLIDPDPQTAALARQMEGVWRGAPTTRGLEVALQQLGDEMSTLRAQDRSLDIRLIIYYAGHADCDNLHLADGMLDRGDFFARVGQVSEAAAAGSVLLDACDTACFGSARGGLPWPLGPVPVDSEQIGMVLVKGDAREGDGFPTGGTLTNVLVSALSGAADHNGNGLVDYLEADAYIDNYMRQIPQDRRVRARVRPPKKLTGRAGVMMELATLSDTGLVLGEVAGSREECWDVWDRQAGRHLLRLCRRQDEARRIYLPQGVYHIQHHWVGEETGREGAWQVGPTFNELIAEKLPGRWGPEGWVPDDPMSGAGASRGRAEVETWRVLSPEEVAYLRETPIQGAVDWAAYPLTRWTSSARLGMRLPLNADVDARLHRDLSAVVMLGADRTLRSLNLGGVEAGAELSLAVAPDEGSGGELITGLGSGASLRAGWVYSPHPWSLRLGVAAGAVVAARFSRQALDPPEAQPAEVGAEGAGAEADSSYSRLRWIPGSQALFNPDLRADAVVALRPEGPMALELGVGLELFLEGRWRGAPPFNPYGAALVWGGLRW